MKVLVHSSNPGVMCVIPNLGLTLTPIWGKTRLTVNEVNERGKTFMGVLPVVVEVQRYHCRVQKMPEYFPTVPLQCLVEVPTPLQVQHTTGGSQTTPASRNTKALGALSGYEKLYSAAFAVPWCPCLRPLLGNISMQSGCR